MVTGSIGTGSPSDHRLSSAFLAPSELPFQCSGSRRSGRGTWKVRANPPMAPKRYQGTAQIAIAIWVVANLPSWGLTFNEPPCLNMISFFFFGEPMGTSACPNRVCVCVCVCACICLTPLHIMSFRTKDDQSLCQITANGVSKSPPALATPWQASHLPHCMHSPLAEALLYPWRAAPQR